MIVPKGATGAAFGTATDGNPRLDGEARRRISLELGIPEGWAWVRQVHGAEVAVAIEPGIGGTADAIVTIEPELPVAVSVADCFPVALIGSGVAGMAHAGWRGAAAGVVEATISSMEGLGRPPHTAVVGPGIGPCCFEVGPEVRERFPAYRAETSWGTASVDLPGVLVAALDGLAVHWIDGCTHHDDTFNSYRRDGTAERQFGVAWVPA